MIVRTVLTAWMVGLAGAATAHAGTIETKWGGNHLTLAGDRTAWLAIEFQRSLSIETALPNGPVSRAWTAPDDLSTQCDQVLDVAGSPTRLAVLYQHPSPEYCLKHEVLAGPVGGPLSRVQLYEPGGENCAPLPAGVALEGDRLAVLHNTCRGLEVAIHDLAAGGPPRIVQPRERISGGRQIRIGGGRIAIALSPGLFQPAGVAVLDASTGEQVLRVDTGNQEVRDVRLGADGRVAYTVDAPEYKGFVLSVASPQDPTPRQVPVPLCAMRFGYEGGDQVFVCRRDQADLSVVGLSGALRSVVARRPHSSWLAFDGRRIAWTHGDSHTGYVTNEAWPYSAPEPPGPDPLGGGRAPQRAISASGAAAVELAARRRRALAVWLTGRSIKSRLLNASGVPVHETVAVSRPGRPGSLVVQPTVAAGPRGRWLVAWTGTGAPGAQSSVRTRLVKADGVPSGAERVLPGVDGEAYGTTPSVIGIGGGYVVAWHSARRDGSARLLAVHLDARGRRVGKPRVVQEQPAGSSAFGADLIATGEGRALLAWSHGAPGAKGTIHAQSLDASGRPVGQRMRLSAPGGPQADSVVLAHHRTADRTLAIWREGDVPFTGDVKTVVLGSSGRPVGRIAALRGISPDARMAAAPSRRGFLVAGLRSDFLGDRDVYAVATRLDARVRGKPFRVSRMGPDRTQSRPDSRREDGSLPALVRTGGTRLLAGWQGSDDGRRDRIWVRPLSVR